MLNAIDTLRRAALLLCCVAPLALTTCSSDVIDEEASPDALTGEWELESSGDLELESQDADLGVPDESDDPTAGDTTTGTDLNCTTPECRKLGGG